MQNASLTVLNEGSNWSMASSDSQWGQEAAHEMSDSSNEGVQEPALETWLLLDYCDKGSLLVRGHGFPASIELT